MPQFRTFGKKFKERLLGYGHYALPLALALVFLALTFPINRAIRNLVEGKTTESAPRVQAPSTPQKAAITFKQPSAKNPAKYGILAGTHSQVPKTQNEWDQSIKKQLTDPKTLERLANDGSLENVEKTPYEYKRQLRLLTDRINRYEKIVKNDPSDETSRKSLQTIYMLKATLTALEKKITTKGSKD